VDCQLVPKTEPPGGCGEGKYWDADLCECKSCDFIHDSTECIGTITDSEMVSNSCTVIVIITEYSTSCTTTDGEPGHLADVRAECEFDNSYSGHKLVGHWDVPCSGPACLEFPTIPHTYRETEEVVIQGWCIPGMLA